MSASSQSSPLWQETPLIHSQYISRLLGCSAYLKLENLHPSHSFKHRGLSLFVQRAKEEYGSSLHAIVASGGNAGLAAASAANRLGVCCTVFIPEGAAETTLALMRGESAEVVITGKCYAQALIAAREGVSRDSNAVLVPAYDNAILWEGHGSMVEEMSKQVPRRPDAIFCSVGGGGLLGGIIVGCEKVGWDDVPIVTLETEGSNCLHYSVVLNGKRESEFSKSLPPNVEAVEDMGGNLKLAHLSSFSSMASGSLGASQPSSKVVEMALKREGGIQCVTVPDELSVHSAVSFARDHKLLVELACSTTLTPGYNPPLFDELVKPKESQMPEDRLVVFVVCGGFKISMQDIADYNTMIEESVARKGSWKAIFGDGQVIELHKRVV